MADAQSVVELVFRGVDQTGEATQAALKNASAFTAELQKVTGPLADIGKEVLKLEAALLTAGAAITAFAIKAAGDFDEAFRELQTIFSIPADQLDAFRDSILEYSKSSTQSLSQITGALYAAGSAGVDYANSLEFLTAVEKLSVAGRADLESTTKALISALNAYGLGIDEATRFSDAFFMTVKEGQITVPELAENLAKVTGVAATLGVPIEDIGAAIATLTAQGVGASEAFTQVSAILSALIKPTEQAKAVAAELGIEFGAQAIKAKGLEGVLQEVFEATGGNEEQMGKLFGRVEALKGVFFLTGDSADLFRAKLDSLANAAGSTEEAYAIMADAISFTNQALVNSVKNLLIEIGTPLLDEYGSVTRAIAAIFNALGADVKEGQLGGLVAVIEEIMAGAAAALGEAAAAFPEALAKADLSGFENGLRAVTDAINQLFRSWDLTTPEGLARIMEGLGIIFERLSNISAGVIGSFQTLFDAIGSANPEMLRFGESWDNVIGSVLGFAIQIDALLGGVNKLIGGIEILVGVLTAKAGLNLLQSVGLVTNAKSALAALLSPTGALYLGVAASAYKIAELVSILYDWSKASEDAAQSAALLEKTQGLANDELQKVAESLGIAVDSFEEFWALVDSGVIVVDKLNNRWALAADVLKTGAEGATGAFGDTTGAVINLDDTLADFYASQGLEWDAVTGQVKTFGDTVGDTAEATGEAAEEAARWHMELVDGIPTFTQVGAAASAGFNESTKAAEEAYRASDDFLIKMEEIASNERIALIEAKVTLDVAQIEADTRRIEAAFESLNVGIQSTGEVLQTLFSLWAEFDGTAFQRSKLESYIEREYKLREQQFELQKSLIESEIALNYERAASLARGDALITVDGAGLQPHLEAFMWEILRAIQTRVNEDGFEMLLGAPS